MQMYSNDLIDEGNTNEKREKSKKRHHKSKERHQNDVGKVHGSKSQNFHNKISEPDQLSRRSEEENYEPSKETKHKHHHGHNKIDEKRSEIVQTNGGIKNECDTRTLEEQEEARRQRREKKRLARERRKRHEDLITNLQSPLSEPNDDEHDVEHDESRNSNLTQQINEFEPDLMLNDDVERAPPLPKPKKKKGGFAKIFASLKKKSKTGKHEKHSNEEIESNPELVNPDIGSQPAILTKPMRKVRGKSARDLLFQKVNVILMDGEEVEIEIDNKATGALLFMRVCDDIELIEKDFFGITYISAKLQTWFWLEMDKKISRQLGKDDEWIFHFQVKFYPPEPLLLQEDLTRYLLSLQIRQDIYTGKLPCSWITQALLGSFMVQSELGDYDEVVNNDSIDYLREFEFVSNQSDQLLEKISELHKKHVGMLPERADIKYMETAKRLEQYGVDLHPARDNDDIEIFIGISYQGILIYRDRLRIGRFAWPKVVRISYKKNYFYLKIRSERYDDSVAVVGFKLFNHHLAKRLWKISAEQHTFFRMKESQIKKNVSRISSNASSSSCYSCKTLHQYRSMNIIRSEPCHFDRTISKRRTIGSMPVGLNRTGLQYSSMHSLNRPHPRDMTLGKTKSFECLISKKSGSSMGPSLDKENSLGSLTHCRQPALFRPNTASSRDDDCRSGDSINGGESYTVNNDDHVSLPSISHLQYGKPTKINASNTTSIDDLSEDDILSEPVLNKFNNNNNGTKKHNGSVPLPLPADSDSSDSDVTDSVQPLPLRYQAKQLSHTNTDNRSQRPTYQPPPPLPDTIPEPPSTSSSLESLTTGQYMPPPPPLVDLQSVSELSSVAQSRPPMRPKPTVKPKPVVVIKERPVITKDASRSKPTGTGTGRDCVL